MVLIRDPNQTYDFCLPSEAESPDRTTFELAALSGRQEQILMNSIASSSDRSREQATLISDAGRFACRGWRQLAGPDGPVEFRAAPRDRLFGLEVPGICERELWEQLPYGVRRQIGEHVITRAMSGLSGDDRKNS